MTEQKTIWHDKEDFMFYKAVPMKMDNKHIIVHLVVDDVDYWDMILCGEKELNSEAVQYIKKWSCLDDLLKQSNKVERLESEVSRYKAALDISKNTFFDIKNHYYDKINEDGHITEFERAEQALKEITQALEKEEK